MKKILALVMILGVVGATMSGCDHDNDGIAPRNLPPGATKVGTIGNDYSTFEFEIDGKPHTFLIGQTYNGIVMTDVCN